MKVLEELLRDATAGDPVSGMKWTHQSMRILSKALRQRGITIAANTIARLLRKQKFSLRTLRKNLAKVHDRNRNRQFHYLSRMRNLYISLGLPMVSVDTKKKELIGNFKNPGRVWRREPKDVLDHDFPSWAEGRAIPYGIYDVAHDDGYVVVGASHETPSFAVAAIRRWWIVVGQRRYPGKKRLLIQADKGGANDPRKWEWKMALQRFSDEFDLTIVVMHYPPGASKWNPIEHRMFSLISKNWAGEPLESYEHVLKYIRATRSAKGFHCRATLDMKSYPIRLKITLNEKKQILLKPRSILPNWNYTIRPHKYS